MEEKSVLMAEMTSEEIRQATNPRTVVVLPVGALEQHGPHMAVKADNYFVDEIARRAALQASEKVPVLVAPVLPYGCSAVHDGFPGTISVSYRTYAKLIKELGESILNRGFRRLFILNGHGGNTSALALAVEDLYDSTRATIAFASYWQLAVQEIAALRESPPGGICHAGELETSCMLALDPSAVRWERAQNATPEWKSKYILMDLTGGGRVYPAVRVADFSPSGVIGDPTVASPEKGERFLEAIVKAVAAFIIDFADWDPGELCTNISS